MREIKFRAWHRDVKAMSPVVSINGLDEGNDSRWKYVGARLEANELESYCWRWKNIEIMQYTGLKDKNGKEIYEGDIVSNVGRIGRVSFHHGVFVVWLSGIKNWKYLNRGGSQANEVLGNVYENPELLKGDSQATIAA